MCSAEHFGYQSTQSLPHSDWPHAGVLFGQSIQTGSRQKGGNAIGRGASSEERGEACSVFQKFVSILRFESFLQEGWLECRRPCPRVRAERLDRLLDHLPVNRRQKARSHGLEVLQVWRSQSVGVFILQLVSDCLRVRQRRLSGQGLASFGVGALAADRDSPPLLVILFGLNVVVFKSFPLGLSCSSSSSPPESGAFSR